jgi:tetratricopeptide (TPR) repeat protein
MLNKKVYIYILILVLLISVPMKAQTKAYCDTLIERGINAMWKKDYTKSLELLTEARSIADKKNWEKQQFRSVINIGSNYYAMLDYGEALNHYLESYKIAIKQQEPKYEMLALNNIAILYSEEKNFNKAREYFEKAYKTAKEIKDYRNLGLYAGNMGNICNQTNKLDEAKKYLTESLKYLTESNEPLMAMYARISLVENEYLQGNTVLARETAEQLLETAKTKKYKDAEISLHTLITKIYLKEHNYPAAIQQAESIFLYKPDTEVKCEVFGLLSSGYAGNKQYDIALKYKDSVNAANVELNRIRNGKMFESNKVKFEIIGYKNQIADKEKIIALERKIFFAILGAILAALTIIFLVYKHKKSLSYKQRHITALALEKEKNEKLVLEKVVTESLLQQEVLKNDIELKNKKLSAKALYLSSRNELIEEIVTYLAKRPKIVKDPGLASHIQSLKNHLRTNNEWESFLMHFEEVNEGFVSRIKELHPSISANDIKFIAYIYMNVSVKEIANIFNITIPAAKKRKERIASKMELSKDIDLYDYILSI